MLVSMIWPEIELVRVEVGAEAKVRDVAAVGQLRCDGGGEQQHGRRGGKDGAACHPGAQVSVVVHIGVH